MRDRAAGTTRRVSVDSAGAESDGDSRRPHLSADVRFVVFESDATNLVAGDDNGATDVFVHELATGATILVSRATSGEGGNRGSFAPRISADGRYVVFWSAADNLVASDTNEAPDVFLHDRATATTTRVSVGAGGAEADAASISPVISLDGCLVAFASDATNLHPADGDDLRDVYVLDLAAGALTLASVGTDGAKGDDASDEPALSDDGSRVAFSSFAANLAPGDAPGTLDVFVRDLAAGITVPADVDSDGRFGSNVASQSASISLSGDGRFVTFSAQDGTLVAHDTNLWDDEFVHDFGTPLTSRMNVADDGTQSDGPSEGSIISGDGRFVAFASAATTLVPAGSNGALQIYVRERRLDPASWQNYGAGHPGTSGVPALGASADPVLNRDVALTVGNSSGAWTFALLLIGTERVQWPTAFGGDLLVDPRVAIVLALPPAGGSFGDRMPPDELLAGVPIFAQVLEIDPGASEGVSFTPGIELVPGLAP